MKTEEKPIPVNRIKAVLAEKQITAKQLCLAVGKNETTISRWCNNKIQPSVGKHGQTDPVRTVQIDPFKTA